MKTHWHKAVLASTGCGQALDGVSPTGRAISRVSVKIDIRAFRRAHAGDAQDYWAEYRRRYDRCARCERAMYRVIDEMNAALDVQRTIRTIRRLKAQAGLN